METEKELNLKILKISLFIQKKYPELIKYIEEMTITIPNERTPQINSNSLAQYFNSLNYLVKGYMLEQGNKI